MNQLKYRKGLLELVAELDEAITKDDELSVKKQNVLEYKKCRPLRDRPILSIFPQNTGREQGPGGSAALAGWSGRPLGHADALGGARGLPGSGRYEDLREKVKLTSNPTLNPCPTCANSKDSAQ